MFKSKIDFNAFDKHNNKVKDLDYESVRALAKAGARKIVNNENDEGIPDKKAKFYLILDYFLDAKGAPEGHFLDFGENKALQKHFMTVETRSGKTEQRMSESPKKACFGYAYLLNDKIIFQPEHTKIPDGRWAKVLKGLKPFLNGVKAGIQLGDTVLDEDSIDENEVKNKIANVKSENSEEEKAIMEELANEKANGVFRTSTFGHIKKKMDELKKEKNPAKKNQLLIDVKALAVKWLDKYGGSSDKEDQAKKQTLQKLLLNIEKQLEMAEGDELNLFYKKIARDWNTYEASMNDNSIPAKKQLSKTKAIHADILQWIRMYNRKPSPATEEVNMNRKIAVLKTRLEEKMAEFTDLVNAEKAIQEFHQIEKRKEELFTKTLLGNGTEYDKLKAIESLENRINKLKPQLN